jgi:hypothetical protein
MENKSMRKLIFAAVFIIGATSAFTSASLAGEGGGYNGTVVANVYEYLDAHGCPAAGFSLFNCSYYQAPPDRYRKAAKTAGR